MGGTLPLDSEIRSQRLSKPRTSTSSSNLLNPVQQKNESSSPLTPTDTYGLGETATVVTSPTGDVRSRRDARSKLREYLYGPNNQVQTPSSEEDDDGPKRFSKVTGGLKKRLSRRGSSFTQLPSAKSSSLYLTASSGSRLQLSSDLSAIDLEESERTVEHIKEKAYTDRIAAQNHVSSPVDEDKHPDSVMAPIRRRSLFTPGIATRDPNDILRKLPPPNRSQSQVDLAYYYNPLLPETSPLSQLAALDTMRDGRSTPSDLHYSHLGGLKLGTLRVTNGGAASPAPDTHQPVLAMANTTRQDHYNTSSESGKDKQDVPYDHEVFHTTSQVLTRSSDSLVPMNENSGEAKTLEGYAESSKANARRGFNLLRHEHTDKLTDIQDNNICHSCLKSLSKRISKASTENSSRSPDRASVMAQDYMSELPGSPFSNAETHSRGILEPGFEPGMHNLEGGILEDEAADVSKSPSTSAEMWRLFINDAEVRHANSETREDAFRVLTANAASISDTVSHSVSHSLNSTGRKSVGTPHEPVDGKSSTKADSGYHSNESLKTLGSVAVSSNSEEPSSGLAPISCQRLSRSLSHPREMPQPTSSTEKLDIPEQPSRPAPVRPSAMVISKTKPIVVPSTQTTQTSQTTSTTTMTVTYLQNTVRQEGPTSQTSSIPTENSIQQSRPLDPSATKAHKLRKPRPLSQPLPVDLITLQRNTSLSQANIPPVPLDVSSKHADRLREFPLLEHTFPSLQHTQLGENLSTEEPVYIPIRFPSPANAVEEESPSKSISITTRLSQYSTREPTASPLKANTESELSEEEDFAASNLVRSPSWSDFGRRGREKRRLQREKASKKVQVRKDNTELDEEGFPVAEICRSPSWSISKGNKKQRKRQESEKRESEKSPKKDGPKKGNILTRNRSSFILKAERRSGQPGAELTIADFGTVTESLGGSPYDIARGALYSKSLVLGNTNISHPHQMSTAMPRPKSTTGMDEQYATEFARLRSPERSRSSSQSEVPMRRSFDDRMAMPRRNNRPQSMYADAPPVPTVPKGFKQNGFSNAFGARPAHTRSQSMFPEAPSMPDVFPAEDPERPEMVNEHDRLSEARVRPQSMFNSVQPTPAFAAVDLPRHRQILSDRGDTSAKTIRPRSMTVEVAPRPTYVPVAKQEHRDISHDRDGVQGRNSRPTSRFLDVPPVPALPSTEHIEQKEAQISRSSSEVSMTLVGPRKVKKIPEPPKKDIWDSAALAEKNISAPRSQNIWEAHQQAWADRRKAAGDGLLQRNQATNTLGTAQYKPAIMRMEATSYLSPNSAQPSRSRTPSPSKPATRSFHKPLNQLQNTTTASTPSNPIPPPPTRLAPTSAPESASPSFERLTGRYEGGFSYGYEPGVGIGGSAGTRNAKTGASRKSIGFSQGYGVDLSDVPIFVAPSS